MPAGMIFQAHIPILPLNKFIEAFIYFERAERAHTVDRFLPNGDTEILIDFNDGPQFIYDNDSLKEVQACNHVWASGVRTEPITIPSGDGATMMVVSFKKGMAAPFFPFPMDEIADSVIDADLVWGSSFGELRERLVEELSIPKRFSLLEDYLLRQFAPKLGVNPCVEFAVTQMTHRPDCISIARMNEKIGYSQKHFTEMFRRRVGVTPKAYLKIMRFQKAIRTIDAADNIEWDIMAQECGFYDQAHFINDFKHFSGFTPEQYSRIRTNYQNYVPVG
jgi:AraC-like DNA-binding protein